MKIPNDDTCGQCPFFDTRHRRFVGPSSIKKARVAIVGMNPGYTELEQGEYFVGRAGKILDTVIEMLGLSREDIYITNCVKCYTEPRRETVRATHIKYCRDYLDWEIGQVDPELIVVAGDIALQAVCGLKGITSKIKKLLWSDRYNKPVIAILHPAAVLHNPRNKRTFLESAHYIGRFLNDELQSDSDMGEYSVLWTRAEIDNLIRNIKNAGICCFDVENNQKKPYDPDCIIKCFSLAYKKRLSSCIPLAELPTTIQTYAMKAMRYIITAEEIDLLGHHIWFDLRHFLYKLKIEPRGEIWDTQIEHGILDENTPHGLKQLAWEFTQLGGYEAQVEEQGGAGFCPLCEELYLYNNIDADIPCRLHEIFMPQIEEQGLMPAYRNILMPAAAVLSDMEARGVQIDIEHGNDLRTKAEQMIPDIVEKMRALPLVQKFEKNEEKVFNPRSTLDIKKVLFTYFKLPVIEVTGKKREPSTKAAVLERLEEQHESEICKLLLDYRLVQGLHSKYLGKLEELCDQEDRVHTSYLFVPRSGRTSSAGPNLQNIPWRGKEILDVKNCFVPSAGNWLLEPDFNQHEYRTVAEIANEPLMKKAFHEDRLMYEKVLRDEMSMREYKEGHAVDLHRSNASELFSVPYEEVTDDQRKDAKTLSFGVLYGMTTKSLAKLLGCPISQAQAYLDNYYKKFSGIKRWKDEAIDFLYTNKYVETVTGRRRRFPYVNEDAIREGINTLIQGPASDFMLISLIKVADLIRQNYLASRLLMQVHDSLIVDLVPEELDIMVKILRESMESAAEGYLDVPLQVDFAIGLKWGSLIDLWKWEENGRRFE